MSSTRPGPVRDDGVGGVGDTSGRAAPEPVLRQFGRLVRNGRFARLFTVRLVSQCGDGLFQVGLATLFFFSPEAMATPGSVAAAFAVLLLPFTLVGPFAGPLLDRWSRRQTLVVGNAVRVALTLVLAALLLTTGTGPAVHVLALLTLGVNRFLLSALSAGVPLLVPREHLPLANTLTPSLGAISAVVGGAVGFLAGRLLPAGPVRDAGTLLAAAAFFGAASLLALRLRRGELGPTVGERAAAPWRTVPEVARGVVEGLAQAVRYVWRRRTPGRALAVLCAQRLVYGASFLGLVLVSRNLLADPADPDAGLAVFAVLGGLSLAGNGVGILLSPLVLRRRSPGQWITACTVLCALSQVILFVSPAWAVVAGAAIVLGVGMQGTKIAVDTVVHRDTADAVRGRAFALYDMLFNGSFVAAAALGAAVLPPQGWSRPVLAACALFLLAVAALHARAERADGGRPRPVEVG